MVQVYCERFMKGCHQVGETNMAPTCDADDCPNKPRFTKDWCLRMAEREDGAEIGAGLLAADPTPEDPLLKLGREIAAALHLSAAGHLQIDALTHGVLLKCIKLTLCHACGEKYDGNRCAQMPINDDFRDYLDLACKPVDPGDEAAKVATWLYQRSPGPTEALKQCYQALIDNEKARFGNIYDTQAFNDDEGWDRTALNIVNQIWQIPSDWPETRRKARAQTLIIEALAEIKRMDRIRPRILGLAPKQPE